MPNYDYKCATGHKFSESRSMYEEKPAICPECNLEGMKVFTAPLIKFKGDGFYSNDKKTTIDINL